ncbi:MAG: fasciclin domain-containing protein [Bacteroidales bacterium]|nr:fasciclin domain-containing protein [Bacteroidales bacterium]
MKKSITFIFVGLLAISLVISSCNSGGKEGNNSSSAPETTTAPLPGQSGVEDDASQKDVVKVAVGSADHTTLVAALQAAEYVDVLSNAGPFTVFAPTNDAFNKLPKGTVEGLVKPEKKADLRNILEYHVYVGKLDQSFFKDGQTLGMVNGGKVTMGVKDGKVTVNGADIVASVSCSNGIIHIIDAVLLPPAK